MMTDKNIWVAAGIEGYLARGAQGFGGGADRTAQNEAVKQLFLSAQSENIKRAAARAEVHFPISRQRRGPRRPRAPPGPFPGLGRGGRP